MTILHKEGKKVKKIKVSFLRWLKDLPNRQFGDTIICYCGGELKYYKILGYGHLNKCNNCNAETYTTDY